MPSPRPGSVSTDPGNQTTPPPTEQPSSWAANDVKEAGDLGLLSEAFRYGYTRATTRAEFAAIAVALYEHFRGPITGRSTFTDCSDVSVEKAAFVGIVAGVGNNRFDPDSPLTREQAATMLARLANALGKPFPKQAPAFADNAAISSWALEAAGLVQAAGIMGGVGENRFAPQDPYTIEQSIVTIMRL